MNVTAAKAPSVFAGGEALPVLAFLASAIVSVSGCWAFLETANFWAMLQNYLDTGVWDVSLLGESYVVWIIFAAFALVMQWIANCCMLRLRRSFALAALLGYLLCASFAAFSLHHVYDVMKSSEYQELVDARNRERAPDAAIVAEAEQTITNANNEITSISRQALAAAAAGVPWPATRIDSYQSPHREAAARAQLRADQARARLAPLPALPSQRPKGAGDAIAIAFSGAVAFLEGILYWVIGAGGLALTTTTVVTVKRRANGVRSWALGTLALLGLASAPAQAVEVPPAPITEPLVPQAPQPIPAEPTNVVQIGAMRIDPTLRGRELIRELQRAALLTDDDIVRAFNSRPRPGARGPRTAKTIVKAAAEKAERVIAAEIEATPDARVRGALNTIRNSVDRLETKKAS